MNQFSLGKTHQLFAYLFLHSDIADLLMQKIPSLKNIWLRPFAGSASNRMSKCAGRTSRTKEIKLTEPWWDNVEAIRIEISSCSFNCLSGYATTSASMRTSDDADVWKEKSCVVLAAPNDISSQRACFFMSVRETSSHSSMSASLNEKRSNRNPLEHGLKIVVLSFVILP